MSSIIPFITSSLPPVAKTAGYAVGTVIAGPIISITLSKIAQRFFNSENINVSERFVTVVGLPFFAGSLTSGILAALKLQPNLKIQSIPNNCICLSSALLANFLSLSILIPLLNDC